MIDVVRQRVKCIAADFISVSAAWLIFNVIRFFTLKSAYNNFPSLGDFLLYRQVILGQIAVPLIMVGIFAISGYYNRPFFRSRLDEAINTLWTSFVGMLIIFFTALIDDDIPERIDNYEIMLILWGLLFAVPWLLRIILTTRARRRVEKGHIVFPTLIAPACDEAVRLASSLESSPSRGIKVVGYVSTDLPSGQTSMLSGLPVYPLADIKDVCERESISNIVLSPPTGSGSQTLDMLNLLIPTNRNILLTPTSYQLITARGKLKDVIAEPLIELSQSSMSDFTANVKRVSDVVVSAIALIALSPLLGAVALAVRLDSKGPVIYRQERVGYHKKIFNILKFRSMRTDAELHGPALSSEGDNRVTRVGRILRKYRLDELPQFVNVLRGEMSLVGPRPERAYYVDQISRRVPHYSLLCQVRPGITSWGMVKYGYADSIDGMIERLRFDLLYIDNISFLVDMKIIFHTVSTVLSGKGV